MMNVELKPELEHRLERIAQERAQPVTELVEEAILAYLNSLESEASTWVKATQDLLPQVWPVEDFTDWMPLESH
jgi:predicted transcriptional regulator